MTRLLFALTLLAVALWLGSRADEAAGCGVAPHHGERVDVSDEAAYIVWDEKTKTEHFIRRATFNSTSADFGFLVPTPTQPELEVANEYLFNELATVTAAKYEYREVVRDVKRDFGFGCARDMPSESAPAAGMDKSAAPRAKGGVEVLEQKRVGDYDATVLIFRRGDGEDAAHGAAELTKWLAKHRYQSSPALAKWLERYVETEWCLTAFKIASGAQPVSGPGQYDLRAKPIRMSFKAEKPFYPYREPETEVAVNNPLPRTLRVFLAAPARFAGKFGDGAKPWPGQVVWSGPVESNRQSEAFRLSAVTSVPGADGMLVTRTPPAPEGWWLTEFEDRSSPRPGTDEVYFEKAADQSRVERPPIIVWTTREVIITPWWHGAVYYGVPIALVVGGLLLWRVVRRM